MKSTRFISQLVGRIGELSHALDAEESTDVISSSTEPKATREAEIRRVFDQFPDPKSVIQ